MYKRSIEAKWILFPIYSSTCFYVQYFQSKQNGSFFQSTRIPLVNCWAFVCFKWMFTVVACTELITVMKRTKFRSNKLQEHLGARTRKTSLWLPHPFFCPIHPVKIPIGSLHMLPERILTSNGSNPAIQKLHHVLNLNLNFIYSSGSGK